ncbi:hypothetical protein A3E46_00370 [Candidatus Woesebacteria bacterium RIFCSPHIGHO2_12_FULL_46_16]|uniref:Uncharacterized protein n=1 Tax=Candidatus Woesebacteria bacterium RIFCSPHIGHO2_12_FULL_46_16 TaxID=1802513 RepID=A0A1F8B044_9BACT|nr:MAG: hypothetical protein A3E46_00370 [Candidatus Woesebacteria bacterium RIFCSPHIGHO2_12_FULL_46_16]
MKLSYWLNLTKPPLVFFLATFVAIALAWLTFKVVGGKGRDLIAGFFLVTAGISFIIFVYDFALMATH